LSLLQQDGFKAREIFSALANDTRYKIVKELYEVGPKSFTDLAKMSGIESPVLVHHLNKLLEAELVIKRNSVDPNSSQYRIYELSDYGKRFLTKVLAWK